MMVMVEGRKSYDVRGDIDIVRERQDGLTSYSYEFCSLYLARSRRRRPDLRRSSGNGVEPRAGLSVEHMQRVRGRDGGDCYDASWREVATQISAAACGRIGCAVGRCGPRTPGPPDLA